MKEVSKEKWPRDDDPTRMQVFVSGLFLAQVFKVGDVVRLSINRITMNASGRWDDNITWDELQDAKRDCGYGDMLAVEVYPQDKDIVNDANMRHLWILEAPIAGVGWFRHG